MTTKQEAIAQIETALEQNLFYGPISNAIREVSAHIAAQDAEIARLREAFRDGCKECGREKKSRSDNKEWQEGVKRGGEIVALMARAALTTKGEPS